MYPTRKIKERKGEMNRENPTKAQWVIRKSRTKNKSVQKGEGFV